MRSSHKGSLALPYVVFFPIFTERAQSLCDVQPVIGRDLRIEISSGLNLLDASDFVLVEHSVSSHDRVGIVRDWETDATKEARSVVGISRLLVP